MMDRIAIEVENDPSYDAIRPRDRNCATANRRRRDRGGSLCHRQHRQGGGDPLLHGDRLDCAARRPRTAGPARHRPDADRADRPAAGPRLGHPDRLTGDPEDLAGHGSQGLPHRLRGRLREARRRRGDHVRRAARIARRDQHDPPRLRRPVRSARRSYTRRVPHRRKAAARHGEVTELKAAALKMRTGEPRHQMPWPSTSRSSSRIDSLTPGTRG